MKSDDIYPFMAEVIFARAEKIKSKSCFLGPALDFLNANTISVWILWLTIALTSILIFSVRTDALCTFNRAMPGSLNCGNYMNRWATGYCMEFMDRAMWACMLARCTGLLTFAITASGGIKCRDLWFILKVFCRCRSQITLCVIWLQ